MCSDVMQNNTPVALDFDSDLQARLIAAACISLAYIKQLSEGRSVQADEVRECLLHSLGLFDPDSSHFNYNKSRDASSTASWLDMVMN